MENTPLYDALRAFAAARPLRMHMPGHKGRPLPAPELAGLSALDFTELPPTGDLFSGGDAIEAAEALWAKVFRMAHCLFLTGGATQGVQAALALACRPGDAVLLDRGSHRSAYNALALLDLRPVYLERPWLPQAGVTGPVSPQSVEQALKTRPDIKTVCITSPTYYGVLSDLPALAAVCRAHGAVLVVDGAHGAHLPFLGNFDLAAADLAVVSAHKTLPAPGQSALLLAGGSRTAGASPRPQMRWPPAASPRRSCGGPPPSPAPPARPMCSWPPWTCAGLIWRRRGRRPTGRRRRRWPPCGVTTRP